MPIRARFAYAEQRLYGALAARARRRRARRLLRQGTLGRPEHLLTGEEGEALAYLHLRERGYTVVARRWHAARLRGDLDLVAWDGDTLVLVEVKTRTAQDFAPAASAVDEAKRRMLRRMGLAYLRQLPEPWRARVPVRCDILSVYLLANGPAFDHIPHAFLFGQEGGV